MNLKSLVTSIQSWLHAGYPRNIRPQDRQPLMALLGHRLSYEEVVQIRDSLALHDLLPADRIDIGITITRVAGKLPTEADILRVKKHLEEFGWVSETGWEIPKSTPKSASRSVSPMAKKSQSRLGSLASLRKNRRKANTSSNTTDT